MILCPDIVVVDIVADVVCSYIVSNGLGEIQVAAVLWSPNLGLV